MSIINQLLVTCSLGFMAKMEMFENREACWELTLWRAVRSHCLAFAVALSGDGRGVLWHAQREASVGFLREIRSSFVLLLPWKTGIFMTQY